MAIQLTVTIDRIVTSKLVTRLYMFVDVECVIDVFRYL
jgi:hypothetical protein